MRSALISLWCKDPFAHSVCNVETQREREGVESNLHEAAVKIVNGEKIWIEFDDNAIQAVFHLVRFELKKLRNRRDSHNDLSIETNHNFAQMACGGTPENILSSSGARPSADARPNPNPRSNSNPRSVSNARPKKVNKGEEEQLERLKRIMERSNEHRSRGTSLA